MRWQTHTCVGGSSDPSSPLWSTEVTEKEAAGQSRCKRPSCWAAAPAILLGRCSVILPAVILQCHLLREEQGRVAKAFVYLSMSILFSVPFIQKRPATAPLPPKDLPLTPPCTFLHRGQAVPSDQQWHPNPPLLQASQPPAPSFISELPALGSLVSSPSGPLHPCQPGLVAPQGACPPCTPISPHSLTATGWVWVSITWCWNY